MSDVFEQAKGTVPEAQENAQPTTPQVAVEYNGKVWKQEDILTKFQNADSYIAQLKAENERLAQEAARGKTFDEVLSRMDNKQDTPKPVEPTKTPVAEVDVEAVAMNAYQKMKMQEQMQANLDSALGKLSEVYGEKTVEVLKQKAAEYDLTLDEAKQLAMTKPKLFSAQFLSDKQQKVVSSTTGNINTQTLQQAPKEGVKLSQLKGKDYVAEVNRRLAEAAKQ